MGCLIEEARFLTVVITNHLMYCSLFIIEFIEMVESSLLDLRYSKFRHLLSVSTMFVYRRL